MEPMTEELRNTLEAWLKRNRQSMIEDIMELTRVRSVAGQREGDFPFGVECAKVLETAAKIGKRRGFDFTDHEHYCADTRLPGKGGKTIGLFCHLDVVPEGSGWTTPPYEPVVKDGHIFGRGPGDNKGPAIAALCLLQFIREQRIRFDHDLLLWYGTNEEAGMEDIKWYIKNIGAPEIGVVPDGTFPVCNGEKGRLQAEITIDIRGTTIRSFTGGVAINAVPETASIELAGISVPEAQAAIGTEGDLVFREIPGGVRIDAKGILAHAADPGKGVSAIHKLTAAVSKAGLAGDKGNKILADLTVFFDSPFGAGLGIPLEDAVSGKLTCVGGLIKVNDGKLTQSLQVRYPVTADKDKLLETFNKTMDRAGFAVKIVKMDPPHYLPPDRPLVTILTETFKEFFGQALPPFVSGGGTYAGKLPYAVAFGARLVSRPRPGGDLRGGGHQIDECVSVEGMEDMIRIYLLSLLRLDKLLP